MMNGEYLARSIKPWVNRMFKFNDAQDASGCGRGLCRCSDSGRFVASIKKGAPWHRDSIRASHSAALDLNPGISL